MHKWTRHELTKLLQYREDVAHAAGVGLLPHAAIIICLPYAFIQLNELAYMIATYLLIVILIITSCPLMERIRLRL